MSLYHFQIGFPKGLTFVPLFGLKASPHAREEAYRDPYGEIELPKHFLPRVAKVIEIETNEAGELIKILARQKLDETYDVVYAVNVKDKIIKTAWRNARSDRHFTLDRTKYDRP